MSTYLNEVRKQAMRVSEGRVFEIAETELHGSWDQRLRGVAEEQ